MIHFVLKKNKVYSDPVHTNSGGISKRSCLPSKLIRHENEAFRKLFSNRRNLKTPALRFTVDGKHFENGASRKRWHYDIVPSLPEFSLNKNQKWPVIVAFSNSSGVVWTENIWCVLRVKPPFSNSSDVVWTGRQSRLTEVSVKDHILRTQIEIKNIKNWLFIFTTSFISH